MGKTRKAALVGAAFVVSAVWFCRCYVECWCG